MSARASVTSSAFSLSLRTSPNRASLPRKSVTAAAGTFTVKDAEPEASGPATVPSLT